MTENAAFYPGKVGVRLNPHEIHIWRANLDVDSAVREHLSTFLSLEERERGARFAFARDRDRFLVRRAVLRQLLGSYLGDPPQDIILATQVHGKPTLTAATRIPSLRFNLSHSDGLALFAFCLGHEVGIDVEKIRPEVAFEGIESNYFSPKEQTELRTIPAELRAESFFLCWTRKEAYIKARGEGLHIPLESFDVSLAPGKLAILNSSDKDRWSLYSLRPGTGFVGALVAEGHEYRLQFWEWRESDLSQSL
jgi:4'-phosphopantetheinyl transferase